MKRVYKLRLTDDDIQPLVDALQEAWHERSLDANPAKLSAHDELEAGVLHRLIFRVQDMVITHKDQGE